MPTARTSDWAKWAFTFAVVAAGIALDAESADAQQGLRLRGHFGRHWAHRHVHPGVGPQLGPAGMPVAPGGYPGAGAGAAYYPGAATPQAAYPYYTTKGPNDFFYNGGQHGGW